MADYATKNLPLTGQKVVQGILETKRAKADLTTAATQANTAVRDSVSGVIRSAINDPKATSETISARLQELAKTNPDAAPTILATLPLVRHIDSAQGMKDKNDMLTHLSDTLQPSARTSEQMQPSIGTYQGQGGVQPYQTNLKAPGGVQNVGGPLGPQGVAPQVVTYPSGSVGVFGGGGQQGGAQSAPRSTQRTAADDAPPPNAPKQIQEAYSKAVGDTNAHVESVRTADENYGNNKTIASTIRRLSADAKTGPGTETFNKVLAALGTDAGNNAQELGAFLDRQAATVRGQMGLPGTNAGAEDAKMISGNTGYTSKVIQDKNDYTEALTEGLHQYRNGLDRVAGFGGQASPTAVNQFKAAWTQNFDPNVYKGELAYKRSKAEGDAFVKSLSKEEAASLAQKRKVLQQLSNGQIPQ